MHADASPRGAAIIESFRLWAVLSGGIADIDRRLYAGGLCFLPVSADADAIAAIADFSFLRIIRSMPELRPITRTIGSPLTFDCNIPDIPALDPDVRVAIFDGGPIMSDSLKWATDIDAPGLSGSLDVFREHGLGSLSALLFGHIEQGKPLPQPYCNVDVIRVLDDRAHKGRPDYFDVLTRIVDVLDGRSYQFVNLSIGPDLPVDDNHPHAWTSVLDKKFFDQNIMAFCAVGNNGDKDWSSGKARVQPPSDGVNVVGIGSCDSTAGNWNRSPKSAVGPGRSPGVVRPDLVAFGGCPQRPFFALGPLIGTAVPMSGTSLAAPAAMRIAIGVRAILGPVLKPLAIKALLVNRAEIGDGHSMREIGWGRIAESPEVLIESDDSTAHIIYQHHLSAGQWMRAPIPVPSKEIKGNVTIAATCCFMTDTDPHHPINYTRAGIELRFRPHSGRKKSESQKNANTGTFFSVRKMYKMTEAFLRSDAHKWETVVHHRATKRGSSLHEPCFDLHYHAREGGANPANARPVTFALVVTIQANREKNLYNQIASRYRTVLQALQPVRLPIPVKIT